MKKWFILLLFIIFSLFPRAVSAQITGIKIAGDTCTSLTLALQAEGTTSSPYFFWNFGDPASGTNDTITITGASPSPFPTHTFTGPGVYNVCVQLQEPGFGVTTICRQISIGLCCTARIVSRDSCLQLNIPFSVNSSATISSVSWNFGDPASGANNTATALAPVHRFSAPGTYNVTATATATCGNIALSFTKTIVACETPSPCEAAMSWRDTCLQRGSSFTVSSDKLITGAVWDFGDPSAGTSNTATGVNVSHTFSASGNYTVRAIVQLSCGVDTVVLTKAIIICDTSTPTNCVLSVADGFTPNDDGINDFFGGTTACPFEQYECSVFNRWGGLIFKTNNPAGKWDGRLNGRDCDMGTYHYLFRYKFRGEAAQKKFGTITLIR